MMHFLAYLHVCTALLGGNRNNLEIRRASTGDQGLESDDKISNTAEDQASLAAIRRAISHLNSTVVLKDDVKTLDAYIIAPPPRFARIQVMLNELKGAVTFNLQRIEPVSPEKLCIGMNESNAYAVGQYGCWLAHQRAWSKIIASGRAALVMESDAAMINSIGETGHRLREAVDAALKSERPIYFSVGHCGVYCTTAYIINPKASEIATKTDYCKTPFNIDKVIYTTMCCSAGQDEKDFMNQQSKQAGSMYGPKCLKTGPVDCRWESGTGLTAVTQCPTCMGGGLFVQNRSIRGLSNGGGGKRETRQTKTSPVPDGFRTPPAIQNGTGRPIKFAQRVAQGEMTDEIMRQHLREKHIVVTGGAGYVGSHAVLQLLSEGFLVTIVDNLSRGHRSTLESLQMLDGPAKRLRFVKLDITQENDLSELFRGEGRWREEVAYGPVDMVWHFAAYTFVGESVRQPGLYERNNVIGTASLLAAMGKANITAILFASSCSVYGNAGGAVVEETSLHPLSPYGRSKMNDEALIRGWVESSSARSGLVFRLFNVVGSDPHGRIGEHLRLVSKNISSRISQMCFAAALHQIPGVPLHGTHYHTNDGTAMRDFIHVNDVVRAFIAGARGIRTKSGVDADIPGYKTYNVGSGIGYTVKEFLNVCKSVTRSDFKIDGIASEKGGSSGLYANISKISAELSWKPQFSSNLGKMLETSWAYARNHNHDSEGVAGAAASSGSMNGMIMSVAASNYQDTFEFEE